MKKNFSLDLQIVGDRIRRVRKGLHMTQEAIAERTDLTGQYWSLIETGRYRGSILTYLQIASALGVTLNDLFYDEAENIRIQPTPEYAEMLAGLNEYEKQVLLCMIFAMKDALMRLRDML